MIYGSVCSGIEAATVAWHPLGWTPAWFSEIEPFPSRVLSHHYPTVPNLGDMLKLLENETFQKSIIDLLVGGTPCQSFSVAGLRAGLAALGGNLALQFCRILANKRPRWFVWENVPGVFSSYSYEEGSSKLDRGGRTDGREFVETADFAEILSGFQECGYCCAWRVLDAQYFGVPQRRRRVFVVGYLGSDWRPPAAVLFEPQSLRRNSPKSGETGKDITGTLESRATGGGCPGSDGAMNGQVISSVTCRPYADGDTDQKKLIVGTLDASFGRLQGASGQDADHGHSHLIPFGSENCSGPIDISSAINHHPGRYDFATETLIVDPKYFEGRLARNGRGGLDNVTAPLKAQSDGTGKGDGAGLLLLYPKNQITSKENRSNPSPGDPSPTLSATDNQHLLINTVGVESNESDANYGSRRHNGIITGIGVRRITPMEAERLQGFPDRYTAIPGAKDGPRYKSIGNSMPRPVMAWIGRRIDHVDKQIQAASKTGISQ